MWEPRRLTTLWASTACYRDSLALPFCISASLRRLRSRQYRVIPFLKTYHVVIFGDYFDAGAAFYFYMDIGGT
jgi:hypothetical protein